MSTSKWPLTTIEQCSPTCAMSLNWLKHNMANWHHAAKLNPTAHKQPDQKCLKLPFIDSLRNVTKVQRTEKQWGGEVGKSPTRNNFNRALGAAAMMADERDDCTEDPYMWRLSILSLVKVCIAAYGLRLNRSWWLQSSIALSSSYVRLWQHKCPMLGLSFCARIWRSSYETML